MKEKPKIKLKNINFYIKNGYHNNVFDTMTHYSKSVFNYVLFVYNTYKYFQDDIFYNLYLWIQSNQDISKYFKDNHKKYEENKKDEKDEKYKANKSKVHDQLYSIYEKYYNLYSSYKKLKDKNNKIIYDYINEHLDRNLISSESFKDLVKQYILETEKLVSFDQNNKLYVHDKIVTEIFISIYYKIYHTTKSQVMNNEPFTLTSNKVFIEEIKKDKMISELDNSNKFLYKIRKDLYVDICAEENIIGRLVYKYIKKELKEKLPSDIITNIIKKVYESIKGYYALRAKGIRANKPYYKMHNEKNNLFYFNQSFRILDNNKRIRLTVGENISKEFENLINNDCMNNNFNIVPLTEYTFTYKNYLQTKIKKEEKKNYVIVKDSNGNKKYVKKEHIYDNYYIYIDIPKKLRKENIRYIEIIPIYEGHKYKVNITYEDKEEYVKKTDIDKIEIKDSISVDLGMSNLMTIYNPTGEQYIINGNSLKSMNEYYNKEIAKCQSDGNKEKQNELLMKREKEMKEFIIELIRVILEKYKEKKLIIMGYNANWKQNIKIGRKNNRMFMEIPYKKIINKLKDKLSENGIEMRTLNESYTSKCDAQSLEEICKKDTEYNGTRVKRGLYVSKKTKKAINADMNGAINIMRKHYGRRYDRILGNVYNPRVIKIIGKSCKEIVDNKAIVAQ